MSDDTDVRLARIEAKVDVVIAQTATEKARVDDHEVRLRTVEASNTSKAVDDHEGRIRAIEKWKYALPLATLAALIAGAASVIAAIKGG
ncbi:hypothetical protein Ssi03_62810 [Sphaerisporangium siamense]|uniref:Uncharacterized protein n=1 Tax=Sphaerisporangium siamense TaxID=795645 RepID=A0A7W7D9S8_9ACTN|nr:hypothetical protein [Sphaerisporangium siamense]MBB4702589.1 hypothetical protein [Sphaerisporangium siamense]GII88291.1 hypothetical protein Ssi03_62810 [Sphaerisporangium siamense]